MATTCSNSSRKCSRSLSISVMAPAYLLGGFWVVDLFMLAIACLARSSKSTR